MSLKLSCLDACSNDVKAASELYDFVAGDLDLPDTDPIRPTGFEQVKQNAEEVFAWIGSHKEDIVQGYQFIKGMTKTAKPVNVPPIPNV